MFSKLLQHTNVPLVAHQLKVADLDIEYAKFILIEYHFTYLYTV